MRDKETTGGKLKQMFSGKGMRSKKKVNWQSVSTRKITRWRTIARQSIDCQIILTGMSS